jgi:hypothetical protein
VANAIITESNLFGEASHHNDQTDNFELSQNATCLAITSNSDANHLITFVSENSNEITEQSELPAEPFHPDVTCIPVQSVGSRTLKFQAEWYKTFSWLHYSCAVKGVLCYYCAKADRLHLLDVNKRRENVFLKTGFRNWKKGPQKFREHQSTACHTFSIMQIEQQKKSQPILSQLSNEQMIKQKEARQCLLTIFTTIRFLARQGLAIRGHTDNNSNFLQLLQLRQADINVLGPWMQKKCDFTSPTIQNEILSLFGQEIVRTLAGNILKARHYAVIVDGTTDISGKHQESICIRYVDSNLQPREEFIGLYEAPDSSGKTIATCILDVFTRLQLPIAHLRGQTYDGASNMSGVYRGCQAIIHEQQPLALYVHCGAHCVNLVSQITCESLPLIRDAIAVVQELGALFSASSNLRITFESIALQLDMPTLKIKPLCPTRWLVRVSAIERVIQQFSLITDSLQEVGNNTSNAATRARGLMRQLQSGSTILGLLMALEVLRILEQLNR